MVLMTRLRMFLYNLKESFFSERSRWFIWSPVIFGLGVGTYFSLPIEISKWIILLFVEILLVLAFIFRRDSTKLFALMIIFLYVMGFAVANLQTVYISKKIYQSPDRDLYLTAKIVEIEHNYRGKQRIVIDEVYNFDEEEIKGKYKLTLTSQNEKLRVGDCIEAVATISPPTKPFLEGGYQPQRQAFFEGISGVGYISSRVHRIDCAEKSSNFISDYIGNMRQKIAKRISSVLPKEQAAVVAAISVGDRINFKPKLTESYRDSGLAHFLSISGLHMSMIAGLMFFLIRMITASIPFIAVRVDSKKISAVAAIAMSFIYLMISGMEIPAQRAFIMTTIVLVGILFDRIAISMRVVAFAAFVVLFISPQALIGPSFQMSFSAVIALIAFYERYAAGVGKFLKGDGYYNNSLFIKSLKVCWIYIVGILITDLVASITTSFFAVYHFNRIAVYTTLGNMLAGPIIGFVIMPFLLVSLILMPFGLDYVPLKITGFGVGLVNDITADVAALPSSSVQVLAFPLWSMIFMTIGGLWVCIWQTRWRKWGWFLIFIGFVGIFTVSNPDVIVNEDMSAVAVKDSRGDIIVLPSKGNYSLKRVWREKTASRVLSPKENKLLKEIYSGNVTDENWINLKCTENYCDYKSRIRIYKDGRLYDLSHKKYIIIPSGGSIIIKKDKLEIRTIEEYVGKRIYSGKML